MTSVLLRIATQRSNSHTFVYTRLKKRWAPTSHVLLLVDQWHQSAGAACPVWTRARADDRYRHLLPSSRCTRNNFAALGLFLHAAICICASTMNVLFWLSGGRAEAPRLMYDRASPKPCLLWKKRGCRFPTCEINAHWQWGLGEVKKKKEKEEGKNNNKMLFLKKVVFFQI